MRPSFRFASLACLVPVALVSAAALSPVPVAAPSAPAHGDALELYAINMTKGVQYTLYTVPPDQQFVLTDVVAMSQSLAAPSGSFWMDFRREISGAPTLAFTMRFGESFEHTYRNGIVFDEGQQVLVTTNHNASVLDKASLYLTGEVVRK